MVELQKYWIAVKKKKKEIRDEMHTEYHGQFKYNTM